MTRSWTAGRGISRNSWREPTRKTTLATRNSRHWGPRDNTRKVEKALGKMKNGKAVGPDNIPAEVGKCLYRKSWSEVLDRYLHQDLGRYLTNGKEASWFLYLRRKGTSWAAETTGQSSPCDTAWRFMRECLNTACERRWTSVSSLDSWRGDQQRIQYSHQGST